jgi:hypothetical protein
MKRGQSLKDFELNQKPDLINHPYCKHINYIQKRIRKLKLPTHIKATFLQARNSNLQDI